MSLLMLDASFDPDGGDVECRFEVESRPGLIDVITTPDCAMTWNWTDGGAWELTTIVTDDELDSTTARQFRDNS